MSNNNSFFTFLAGAAFGAAAYAFVKSDKEKVKEALDKLENMLVEGADYFMEIGPGNVLQGLVKRISGGMVTIEGKDRL